MPNMEPTVGRHGDDPGARQVIDENLRRVYAELLEQDVSERFQGLLDRLRGMQGTKR